LVGVLHFLYHVLHHHQHSSPNGCPHYEALIWQTKNTMDTQAAAGGYVNPEDRD
jgi:hypothetical protein